MGKVCLPGRQRSASPFWQAIPLTGSTDGNSRPLQENAKEVSREQPARGYGLFPSSLGYREAGVAGLLLLCYLVLALSASRQIGITLDEPVGMASGYALLTQGEFRIEREQPPLVKIVAALPLLKMHPGFDPDLPSYREGRKWAFANDFLFGPHAEMPPEMVKSMVRASRKAVLIFPILLGIVLFLWTARIFGGAAGLLALAFFCFDPSFLAHGPMVKFDIGVTLFIFLSQIAFFEALKTGSQRLYFLAGLFAGLGLGTKLTAVLVLPMMAAVLFATRRSVQRGLVRGSIAFLVGGFLGVSLPYGFILLPELARGIAWYRLRMKLGLTNYFAGETAAHGFPLFYPACFFLKTPLPTLGAILLSAGLFLRRRKVAVTVCLLAAITYFVPLLFSPRDAGVRYLFPIFPFLFVVVGGLASPKAPRMFRVGGFVLAGGLVFQAIASHPYYLGFTNLFAGSRPERIFAASNLDWGHGLPQLARYMRQHKVPRIKLAFSGMDRPEIWGIRYEPAPCHPTSGLIAGSIDVVYGNLPPNRPGCYHWLRNYEPVDRVGTAFLIYRIRLSAGPAP